MGLCGNTLSPGLAGTTTGAGGVTVAAVVTATGVLAAVSLVPGAGRSGGGGGGINMASLNAAAELLGGSGCAFSASFSTEIAKRNTKCKYSYNSTSFLRQRAHHVST